MHLAKSKQKQKAAEIVELRLESLFPEVPIPLHHTDSYTLLIAVLLSAQCTDERVNKITPALFARASTPFDMIKLTPEDIDKIVKPLGLSPMKANYIWQLSRDLIDNHHGKVPSTFEELEKLPGVGHKTASVVMCQAFNHPAFPVDTHIHRLAKCFRLSSGKNVVQTEKDLKAVFPQSLWGKIHLQMIYYGRTYCPKRKCDAKSCMLCQEIISAIKKK